MSKFAYERIETSATYAPWKSDLQFMEIYNRVKGNTLVDIYRCYELWSLVGQCSKMDGDLLEVGVWRGGTAAIICRRSQLNGRSSTVYLADTFRGVVKAGKKDHDYQGGEHKDTSLRTVEGLFEDLDLHNYMILNGVFPEATAHLANQSRFCLIHIDVDVYQSAKDIEEWAWNKLVLGGMIVYDDYGYHMCSGITTWVEEKMAKPDRLVLYNLNGHAIVVKIR